MTSDQITILTHAQFLSRKKNELIKKFDIKIDYLELRNTKNLKLTNKIKNTKIEI